MQSTLIINTFTFIPTQSRYASCLFQEVFWWGWGDSWKYHVHRPCACCARWRGQRWAQQTSTYSFNLHSATKQAWLAPFYAWWKESPERFSNLLKVTQPLSSRAEVWIQIPLILESATLPCPRKWASLEGCQHERLCPLVMEIVITFGAGSCKACKVEAIYRRNPVLLAPWLPASLGRGWATRAGWLLESLWAFKLPPLGSETCSGPLRLWGPDSSRLGCNVLHNSVFLKRTKKKRRGTLDADQSHSGFPLCLLAGSSMRRAWQVSPEQGVRAIPLHTRDTASLNNCGLRQRSSQGRKI